MKVLHLTLKKKWFDMIASGEKKEEYREIKPFFQKMFEWHTTSWYNRWQAVTFINGYRPNSPRITFEILNISKGDGRPEWGAEPGKKYFVIKLGEKIPNDEPITKTQL